MNTTVTVDHTPAIAASTDAYLPCTECGQIWRVFPRAMPRPYALPVEPPTLSRSTYRVLGGAADLFTTLDDGQALTVSTSWRCTCGALQIYDTPTTERVECECGRAALLRHPPDDYYVNPRYGMACACCGRDGVHIVPRAQVATFQCRRSW